MFVPAGARPLLIVLPLLTCAARFHARSVSSADVTRELTRYLGIVRVAASRRSTPPALVLPVGGVQLRPRRRRRG